MKLSLLVATSQLNSQRGRSLGTGTMAGLRYLADAMLDIGIEGDIYDLPNGSRNPDTASPFSLNNGFALNPDELDLFSIPELGQNKTLCRYLTEIELSYKEKFSTSRLVSYTLKRSLIDLVLRECFLSFQDKPSGRRRNEFAAFLEIAEYWLDDFALYELYKEQIIDLEDARYRDKSGKTVLEFLKTHRTRILYHKYVQFLYFEQRQSLKKDLEDKGVGLIVNLPFGVEFNSADVFFHPEVFDHEQQVGCSPEPEHGYPEQAWGMALYKEGTPGLERYLIQRMNWLKRLGKGIFIDHLVGWCGQYALPAKAVPSAETVMGEFLTTDEKKRKKNLRWFLNLVLKSGLRVVGEVAGDHQRVTVTKEVIDEMIERKKPIKAMCIPRWESEGWDLKPLKEYEPQTLVMVDSHDTSTLLQYLTNQKGDRADFEDPWRILEFCQRVLGLPLVIDDVPFKLDEMSDEFCFELVERLVFGTPSTEIVFTLSSLITMLSPRFKNCSLQNNINVQPGTSGEVGNPWNNWSFYSPPIEILTEDGFLKERLKKLGQRKYRPFDPFLEIEKKRESSKNLFCYFKKAGSNQIVYRAPDGCWKIWEKTAEFDPKKAVAELVVYNHSEAEAWDKIALDEVLKLDREGAYLLLDLNQPGSCYRYDAEYLAREWLFVKLQSKQVHHFVIFFEPGSKG